MDRWYSVDYWLACVENGNKIHVAWDILETVNNQYLGLKGKMSQIINWIDVIPKKFCATRLGLPRRYMVLSDFMLCPVFMGNHGLERESSKLKDTFR